MTDTPQSPKDHLLYAQGHYHGDFTPQDLVFNANLQEFATKISYICGLETGGKISAQDAYDQIKHLWKELTQSKEALGIGEPRANSEE
ncbi:MAG: hypothetical protein VKJ46_12160 [Leptolyngbyaceae bacterium]|nr:hypothetical protein [Leptolyngbyaceae bacterium]